MSFGIAASLGALLMWMFGDFLIQRTVRRIGVPAMIMLIAFVGSIGLLPFVFRELPALFHDTGSLVLLLVTGFVMVFAFTVDFRALRAGKLAIIEPILGIELPVTIGLSIAIAGERPSLFQGLLMLSVFLGIVLAVTSEPKHLHYHKRILEKGALLAGLGAIVMGLVNFLVGVGSESISPLVVIWFTSAFAFIAYLLYLWCVPSARVAWGPIRKNAWLILATCVADNAAWIFFAVAASRAPIGIVTTISECYIALAVLLGVLVNKEKINGYQKIGIAVAVGSMILLSVFGG